MWLCFKYSSLAYVGMALVTLFAIHVNMHNDDTM